MEPTPHEESDGHAPARGKGHAPEHGDGDEHEQTETPVGRRPPESGTRYSAREIHDTVAQAARDELERPLSALWWSAFGAGLLIGFSFLGAGLLGSLSTDPLLHRLLVGVGYPLGFVFVVLGSVQLFTENTLDPILPLLESPNARTLRRVLRLWGILLVGNVLGAALLGNVLARARVLPEPLMPHLDHLAAEAVEGGFWHVFALAVFAGWLIALMAWLISSTADTFAQVALVWLTTMPIAALGFRHAIAGSVEAFFAQARGLASWGDVFGGFLAPCVLGNAVGGVLLVALLFYGQVRADKAAD